ncbi:DUF302 domain-containing protein [Halobacillus litoralis]|uniref:DUF302 domain-containing protein n=1 Tax=Halobacillus litoralis TaxID=45668 RepID=A0A845DS68_9BACI|nr:MULTISPECIES: DUF302 domain-containing protein [Halobacillus]MCA1020695.1 DUF302 domain-containing protein [Halobacillus litoralis]MYL20471.1 DUF302 domain-containing protein [Halobacillus litoralis]MYL29565.1 DUF302 domain-containing protein [Halobacillus halophilus]MYL36780.1 DUF302 domain-containing protein [Halobacillus litoralis]
MFHYTVETNKSVEEAVESLEANLKDEQFGVLWNFDLKGKLNEKGLEFEDDFRVLEVCNPKEAQRVLNQNKMAGYFLPCKVVVYKEQDQTRIGMPKPSSLTQMVNDDQILAMAEDIESRLIHCMDKSI